MNWANPVRGPLRPLSGLIALALGACSLQSAYRQPPLKVPEHFVEAAALPGAPPSAAKPSSWPDLTWWHNFGSAQLDQLIEQAQQANLDLAAAAARVKEADAQARIAGAPLLPEVALSASATREQVQALGVRHLQSLYSPSINASYALDFWGRNRAIAAAAQAGALGSHFDAQTVALTVVSSVASTYFAYLTYTERLHVAEANLGSAEHILDGLQRQRRAGIATALDVAQQQASVSALSATIPPLRLSATQSLYALAVLVGRNPEDIVLAPQALRDIQRPPVTAGLPSELLLRRPDVASAEQTLVAANANIIAARAALFPSISLTASGGFESSSLTTLINPAHRVYAATGGLLQPIFEGGALHAQLAYSKARQTEILSNYRKSVLTALANVESALAAARETEDQQAREQDAVTEAQRAFDFAQRQMSAGTVNVLAVLAAENALFSARDGLLQAQATHLQALVSLYAALGGGWTRQ